jgi:hypothetical protein
VLVFATLGAPERRGLLTRNKRQSEAVAEPEPEPVTTGRATIIAVADPFAGPAEAERWLKAAGEQHLEADLTVLNQSLHAFRVVTADPYLRSVGRRQALVARIGYGAGEEVAEGRWSDALELRLPGGREPRTKVLHPQARLAAVLGQRERALVCEELALRAHVDIAEERLREAALQVLVALDAAVAELSVDPLATKLASRLQELRELRKGVGDAAQAALAAELDAGQRETVTFALTRIEAALRFRAVNNA